MLLEDSKRKSSAKKSKPPEIDGDSIRKFRSEVMVKFQPPDND